MSDLEYTRAKYQSGFKYQLTETARVKTLILGYNIEEKFFSLKEDGTLTVRPGYSWDGATCYPDNRTIMRGSLFHDVLYQMMRLELLPKSHRKDADILLKTLCIRDGMWKWMAHVVYKAVQRFAWKAAHPNQKRKEYTVP